MKKYTVLGLIIPMLLISSCSIDWKDENKEKIESLEKQVSEMKKEKEDDLFKKKQECAKYKDKVELKEIKLNNILKEIFYSSKYNSCLYSIQSRNGAIMSVKDLFTGKQLQSRLIIKPLDVVEFNNSLDNLK
ncbi:MAG: hypothetical protein PHZ26_03600 [Candidatus Gracilibacteria bacterium]|nr:hypothetical protein [Candidatus Gracilibacteria bacterium]MDD2908812.1 hypothetical protein [Candidatus Gracilibacteria bacterium]